jgi:hypothetical protein
MLSARGGAIVNVSSTVGLVGHGGHGAGLAPYIGSQAWRCRPDESRRSRIRCAAHSCQRRRLWHGPH